MRQGQNSKRPRGRGSNTRRNNSPARHNTFDSNGPSVRIRGSAHQVYEKYLTLARDAGTSGDRVAAENYSQHAEHYYRIINVDAEEGGRGRNQPDNAGGSQANGQKSADGGAAEPVDGNAAGDKKAEANGSASIEAPPAEAEVTITTPPADAAEDETEADKPSGD
ncbi:MAG: DUF4167 domain-containing protein [Alphaproteobacteria bacterium]